MKTKEMWYPIKGYENYKVSNLGNIKSIRNNNEKILKPFILNKHFYVTLSKNNEAKNFRVSTLVIENIREIEYNRYYVFYKDGDNSNNADENLIIFKNSKERTEYIKGNNYKDSKKLTERDVKLIYLLSKSVSTSEIAKIFKISNVKVSNIKNRKTYKKYTKELV